MIQKYVAIAALLLSFTGVLAFVGQPGPEMIDTPITLADVLDNEVEITKLNHIEEALLRPRRIKPLPPEKIDSETLWLARAIFSETKRPEEQLLVAWVIRNRVETRFRGQSTYTGVILDPYQFSAFLPDNEKRPFYAGLDNTSDVPGWQKALHIADYVRKSDASARPFSIDTRHFYSERSMQTGSAPEWVRGRKPVRPRLPIDVEHDRFRFFAGII